MGPDNSMMDESGVFRDRSEQTDAELFSAAQELKAKIAKDPGNAEYHFDLSNVYAALFDRTRKQKGKQSDEWLWRSGDALEKVVMIDPKNKVARYNLGVVYKRQGKMERAREELRKNIQICDPQEDAYMLFASWMQIGTIYEEKGFLDEAKEAYLKAREYDYGNEDAKEALSELEMKRKGAETDGNGSGYGMSPMGLGGSGATMGSAASQVMGADPSGSQNPQAAMQALPYLGQMLMNKFGGDKQGDEQNQNS